MNRYRWNEQKNEELKQVRGVSFEQVVRSIESGFLLAVVNPPNQDRYPDQRIYVVRIEEYAYLVPFIKEREGAYFLKTIIPSRKATRDYIRRTP